MSKIENIYSKADEMFFDADDKIREGKIVEARDILINLVNQFPEYGRAYNHLGWIYETKYKDYKKAAEYYKKALEYSPDYPAVYLNYADLLSTLEKFEELEDLLKKAMNVAGVPKERVFYEYGIMYELKGDLPKAIDYYKKAIAASLNEKDIELYNESIERCKAKKDILN